MTLPIFLVIFLTCLALYFAFYCWSEVADLRSKLEEAEKAEDDLILENEKLSQEYYEMRNKLITVQHEDIKKGLIIIDQQFQIKNLLLGLTAPEKDNKE